MIYSLGNIERFVVNAYGGKKKQKDVTTLSTSLASVFEMPIRCVQLPATMSALKYKIFRSHFVCMVLKQSHKPRQNLPLPEGYDRELNGISLGPIITDNLPAAMALIDLSVCSCKGGCATE